MFLGQVTEDEIANAAGVSDMHDGVNFMRAACVIAVEKVRPKIACTEDKLLTWDGSDHCPDDKDRFHVSATSVQGSRFHVVMRRIVRYVSEDELHRKYPYAEPFST